MSCFNYYQSYYQEKSYIPKAGMCVKSLAKEFGKYNSNATDKQMKFHRDLLTFLKDKNAIPGDAKIFERPKSRRDCGRKINALKTIMFKANLADEFYGNYSKLEEEKNEQHD